MTAIPPIWREWLTAGSILGSGVLCLQLGTLSSRRSVRARNAAAAAGSALAIGAAAAHYPPLRDPAGPWLMVPGAEGTLACFGAAVLLGIVRADRERRSSPWLLTVATGGVFLLLLALSSGSLYWHYFGQTLRANYPDASGALQQTTGITCAPAAAAMLLYHSGIRISEGELAELAGTTPLQGTGPYALARAVDRVARRRGLRGQIRHVTYSQMAHLGRPFVAFVDRPGTGGHALLVLKTEAARVRILDPLSGSPDTLPRGEFVAEWDPVVVWVERPGG